MAGRRGCVNSLWSGTERVRIGERLNATLAGILELDVLRCRQLEMVAAALGGKETPANDPSAPGPENRADRESASSNGQQASTSYTESALNSMGEEVPSRWSTLSWDLQSELLSPLTLDTNCPGLLEGDSRPSSGFYSVSGSSLSDSCFSVSSEVALGYPAKVGTTGPCRPLSAEHSGTQWREAKQQRLQSPKETAEDGDRRPVSTGDLELHGLTFLSDLCSSLAGSLQGSLFPSPGCSAYPHLQLQLDPKFCSDLVSHKTKEVYPYPSPLHAVALQSPLFTAGQDTSPPHFSLSPEPEEPLLLAPLKIRTPTPSSLTQLEQYISRLVRQYYVRSRQESTIQDLQKTTSGLSQEAAQTKTSSDSRPSSLVGDSTTPCKLGNSARVSLGSISKKTCRNSINLGNLPSVTGEDFNISFLLNLNLNLNKSLDANIQKDDVSASCGYLGVNTTNPTASPSSSTSSFTTTPALRGRPRISTCPSTMSNRGSLEITGKSVGPLGFSRSLDWSGAAREEAEGCLPQPRSPKLSEDSEVVCDISRVSGLPCSVVIGLMEEGVELDTECFRNERERGEGSASPSNPSPSQPLWSSCRTSSATDFSHLYSKAQISKPRPASIEVGDGSSQLQYLQFAQRDSHYTVASQSGSPEFQEHSDITPIHQLSQRLQGPVSYDSSSSPGSSSSHRRVHSPPRLLSGSPFTPTQLTVFKRNSPSQCSLPRFHASNSPVEGAIRPRGGSLRQDPSSGWRPQDQGCWRAGDGEKLYRGKHASRELVRASTVSSYSGRDYGNSWDEERSCETPKKGNKFWKGLDGRFKSREGYSGGVERYGRSSMKERSLNVHESQEKRTVTNRDGRSSSLHLSRRALFRSESQGILDPRRQNHEGQLRTIQWSSTFEIAGHGRCAERGPNFSRKKAEKHISSTSSLFHLSRSQSLEGSCHSLSPLSSPSFSPSPPLPAPLTRSMSFRDLGRRVFGSMRSLSLKGQKSKK
ncbi:uncharacterized protein LOC114775364 [Denticeps clupeoides]|uniref:Uncharacterized protein n=1 Tax=Denticeps clupeoides TaxID=299321 RepID=A0A8C4FNW0_9TELE|nr:uncharacterized protein LOC114768599 [Denticeps clupeoides]XP_028822327.1 uncharacterized protein LOC114775364 [Denticeps clupeoides]